MIENPNHEHLADALATRSTAADWLVARQMSESWSEEEQKSLDCWLAQSPANRVAYWRLEGAWGQAQRLTALRQPMRPIASAHRVRTKLLAVRAAGAFGLVAVLGVIGAKSFKDPEVRTYATPVGGHLTISLNDGSKIELNTDSVVQMSGNADRRQATLEKGEVYFQIKHNSSRPFVVTVGEQRVTDLGTKFSIRKEAGKVFVSLFEGAARVEAEGESTVQPKFLVPGDVAIATTRAITVTKSPQSDLSQTLAWRRGMIEFKRATLAEAATEFNRYNRTKVLIADPQIGRLTIHGTFQASDVWAFADAAQAYFNLHAEKRNGTVVISR